MTEFLTYTKVHTREEAGEITKLLQASGIEFKIEAERNALDKMYIGESLDPLIAIKIPQNRFTAANKIMLLQAQSQLDDIDPDYYLFSFTNDELTDVLKNTHEWNALDQALAQKLLLERNIAIPKDIEDGGTAASFKPYHLEMVWIIVEYLVSIAFAFAGIIIGSITLLGYKTLHTGSKVKMYDKETRMHAGIMLGIGIVRTLYHYIYLF
jgi:hypothetical protein